MIKLICVTYQFQSSTQMLKYYYWLNEICLKRWRSYIGTKNTPFAQRLNIGWVLFGDICLGNFRKPTTVASFKTTLVDSHRETIFRPCRNVFSVTFQWIIYKLMYFMFKWMTIKLDFPQTIRSLWVWWNLFRKIKIDVWKHLFHSEILDSSYHTNRDQAYKPGQMLHVNLQNNPTKKKHFVAFMNLIECDAMEIALPLDPNQECLYLPLFGVYNPKKPVKIRAVFDYLFLCRFNCTVCLDTGSF